MCATPESFENIYTSYTLPSHILNSFSSSDTINLCKEKVVFLVSVFVT